MTDHVYVVGSGPSGVHFALTLLEKGYRVSMVDVGYSKSDAVNPGHSLNELKANLPDPVEYFLGSKFEALVLPDDKAEYYGFPPNKQYVISQPSEYRYQAQGFTPLSSFASGGLSEAWSGGAYPFRDEELADFPFGYDEIAPYYAKVARRIGITGVQDDLTPFSPYHDGLSEPLDLDEHSKLLLDSYQKRRRYFNEKLRFYVGRSRSAVLSRDLGDRKGCSYTGRCLWGCPRGSFYSASLTLKDCQRYPAFEYLRGLYVSHFRFNGGGKINGLVARSVSNNETHEFNVDKLVLAAGTLGSSRIFLESIRQDSGEIVKLSGLMDNRHVLMPFVNLRMIGKKFNPDSFQLHQLSIGMEAESPMQYVHSLVTTLKTALIHPLVQKLPLDFGSGVRMFRNMHAALGLASINFSDYRREECYLSLLPGNGSRSSVLGIHYEAQPGMAERVKTALKRFRRMLLSLGCVAPPSMTHLRPMGSSLHYVGTIPMSKKPNRLMCSEDCQSYDFPNLYFADGTAFPALPAKNHTLTSMANAMRIAERAF
jgi:choline dehydrogenase-like flavoprotein